MLDTNKVRRSSEHDMYDEHARHVEIGQRAESEFGPIPFRLRPPATWGG